MDRKPIRCNQDKKKDKAIYEFIERHEDQNTYYWPFECKVYTLDNSLMLCDVMFLQKQLLFGPNLRIKLVYKYEQYVDKIRQFSYTSSLKHYSRR